MDSSFYARHTRRCLRKCLPMSLRTPFVTLSFALALGLASGGCGGSKKPAKSPDEDVSTSTDNDGPTTDKPAPGSADDSTNSASKHGANACTGFEMDLIAVTEA